MDPWTKGSEQQLIFRIKTTNNNDRITHHAFIE